MSDDKKLEEWLKQVAQSPELRELMARAESEPPLSDELVAEYYAGTLTPKEMIAVGRSVALSARTSRALAQLHDQAAQAAAEVAPALPWHGRLVRWITEVAVG